MRDELGNYNHKLSIRNKYKYFLHNEPPQKLSAIDKYSQKDTGIIQSFVVMTINLVKTR